MFHTRYTRLCQICTALEMVAITAVFTFAFMYMAVLA